MNSFATLLNKQNVKNQHIIDLKQLNFILHTYILLYRLLHIVHFAHSEVVLHLHYVARRQMKKTFPRTIISAFWVHCSFFTDTIRTVYVWLCGYTAKKFPRKYNVALHLKAVRMGKVLYCYNIFHHELWLERTSIFTYSYIFWTTYNTLICI